MVQLIFNIIICTVICLLWGLPWLLVQKKMTNSFWLSGHLLVFISFIFFAGLINLSFLSSLICLFAPLKFIYLLLLSVLPTIVLFMKRKPLIEIFRRQHFNSLKPNFTELFFAGMCILIFLTAGTLKPANSDTYTYHLQSIRWLNEYGTVPGIANLAPRYGLSSNWFNLISLFQFPIVSANNFTGLNTSLVIAFFLWLSGKWKFHSSSAERAAGHRVMAHYYLLIILFCLFDWELFRDTANSTNYDFIVTAMTLMAISFLIESVLFPESTVSSSCFFAIFCISIIPFKLSGIFILLPLLWYIAERKKTKLYVFTFFAGVIIVLPCLIKNYIHTGYPLYPLSWSITSPDWQLPGKMRDYLQYYIHISNRHYNSFSIELTQLPEMMEKPWIKGWLKGILIQHKFIMFFSALSVFIFVFKPRVTINYSRLKTLWVVLLLMAAGWFISAPSPRLGFGVLLVLALFPVCLYAGYHIPPKLHKALLIFTFLTAGYYLYKKSTPVINNPSYLLYTQKIDAPPVEPVIIEGIRFYYPLLFNNGWMRDCYNTPLPCISNKNKFLKPRGSSLKDGFRMELPDSLFMRTYVY